MIKSARFDSGVMVDRATASPSPPTSLSISTSPSSSLSNLSQKPIPYIRTSNLEPRTSNLEPRTSNLEPRTRHSNLDREDSAAKKQTGDPRKRLEESVFSSFPPLAFFFPPISLCFCAVRSHHADRSSDSYASWY
jgi:hypothetical protein